MCSPIFLNSVVYWHFDLMFFFFAAHKNGTVFSALSHIYMLGEGLSFRFEDCALFSSG